MVHYNDTHIDTRCAWYMTFKFTCPPHPHTNPIFKIIQQQRGITKVSLRAPLGTSSTTKAKTKCAHFVLICVVLFDLSRVSILFVHNLLRVRKSWVEVFLLNLKPWFDWILLWSLSLHEPPLWIKILKNPFYSC
jgi:hypothetical protein